MKETIYTIPINECFDNTHCECPVCEFEKKEEQILIDYTLGASMMEPDSRIITNQKGFCQRHTHMLYNHGNRLSLDLVLQTHIDELIKSIENQEKELSSSKAGIISGRDGIKKTVNKCAHELSGQNKSCAVCDRLNEIMKRFYDNLFYMLKNDADFEKKFFSSNGFCMEHFSALVSLSADELSGQKLKQFVLKLYTLEKDNFDRVLEDVEWFAKKHDWRYKNEDWKNAEDAPLRAGQKIAKYID